jgi:hypothetical protein
MKQHSFITGAVALLCLTGTALAQIAISAEQERDLYTALLQVRVANPPPASFNASVAMDVPADVHLYPMPAEIGINPVRHYLFTVLLDEVVLVDPTTRKVAMVLRLPHE